MPRLSYERQIQPAGLVEDLLAQSDGVADAGMVQALAAVALKAHRVRHHHVVSAMLEAQLLVAQHAQLAMLAQGKPGAGPVLALDIGEQRDKWHWPEQRQVRAEAVHYAQTVQRWVDNPVEAYGALQERRRAEYQAAELRRYGVDGVVAVRM